MASGSRPRDLTFVPFVPAESNYQERSPWPASPYAYDIVHSRNTSTIWSSFPVTDELQLLEWLTQHTTIPVPKVTSQGWDPQRRQHYALFDTPTGMPLADCWEDLSEDARTRTINQLRSILKQLRAVTVDKLPNHGTRDMFLDRRDGVVAGPFTTQTEFLRALTVRVDAIGSIYNPGPTRKAIRFLDAMEQMSMDKRMVLTHGNLNPENVWVTQNGDVTAIIDWSQSGYAPVFWEYIKACLGDEDSEVHLDGIYDDILEPWPLHLAVMMHVHDIIW
ncbi:hypothetical protein NLU13_7185 [Sarocladium strictum]|uniref:Aminoglycoside phosphotransferase domain-containing protein n=1 Tax=Sarocladium strictum TaxID=5046 RepID=A0AA39L5C1_SARSR|nr:hypothetical protein NLU13_7185 [Sarocladium strictum]